MRLFMTITAIFAIAGGLAYALAVLWSRGIRAKLQELTAWIAFDELGRGREVLWEDIVAIYRRINASTGFPAAPPPTTAAEIVGRLQSLASSSTPPPRWRERLRALRRSAPRMFVVPLAGPMLYPTFVVAMMVFGAFILLRARLGTLAPNAKPAALAVFYVVVCIIAAICVIAAISQAQRYYHLLRARRIVAEARARGGMLLPLFPPEREM